MKKPLAIRFFSMLKMIKWNYNYTVFNLIVLFNLCLVIFLKIMEPMDNGK